MQTTTKMSHLFTLVLLQIEISTLKMLTRPRVTAADLPQLQSSVLLSYSSKHAFMHASSLHSHSLLIPKHSSMWHHMNRDWNPFWSHCVGWGWCSATFPPILVNKVSSQVRSTTVPCTQYFGVCIASSETLNYQHELEQHWTLSSVSFLCGCGVFWVRAIY